MRITFRRMLGCLKPHRAAIALALLFSAISVPLNLLAPILIGQAIDEMTGPGKVGFDLIARRLLELGVAIALSVLFNWLMQVRTRKVSAAAAQALRRAAFEQINQAPLSTLDAAAQGDLVSRLINDVDAVSEGLLQALSQLIPGVVTIVATLVVMCVLNLPIALIVAFITPLSILFARFIGRRSATYFREQTVAQGDVSAYVSEMMNGRSLVQAMGYEDAAAAVFEKKADRYLEANFKATFYSSITNPGTRFVNAIVYAAVGVSGALLALSGGITVGSLSAFLSYANQYTKPFNEVTSVITQLQGALASAKRLFDVIDWTPEPPETLSEAPLAGQGLVEGRDVAFSYDKTRPLITDFQLHASPGQRIALVGPTGCGKTTLINLLMRFYEVDSGGFFIDGTATTQVHRNALRGSFGMVLQETWLKRGTVAENIAYARPGASRAEVIEAAKTAQAHPFILQMPKGYDTELAANGGNLSTGQRQLLCIARVVLAKPRMFILDEATSSIDTRTEAAIQKAMDVLMKGHTSFIVAHRLSTIERADQILVMKDGRVVERGTHRALLEKNGFYAGLFHSQFEGTGT